MRSMSRANSNILKIEPARQIYYLYFDIRVSIRVQDHRSSKTSAAVLASVWSVNSRSALPSPFFPFRELWIATRLTLKGFVESAADFLQLPQARGHGSGVLRQQIQQSTSHIVASTWVAGASIASWIDRVCGEGRSYAQCGRFAPSGSNELAHARLLGGPCTWSWHQTAHSSDWNTAGDPCRHEIQVGEIFRMVSSCEKPPQRYHPSSQGSKGLAFSIDAPRSASQLLGNASLVPRLENWLRLSHLNSAH